MTSTIIAAVATNLAIGKDNSMMWKMPADLKWLKEQTTGKYIIMGRKSYESLKHPLSNRTSVVITRNEDYTMPTGHFVVHSYEEAIKLAEKNHQKEVMVLGGGEIYRNVINKVEVLLITEIKAEFPKADTNFPEICTKIWKETWREDHRANNQNPYDYSFVKYEKKK